eukprot:COSAG01_NODE_8209_length_2874_cov_1.887207_4_plen_122_part_01
MLRAAGAGRTYAIVAGHRALPRHLPEQPVETFLFLPLSRGKKLTKLARQIHHDRPALKELHLLPARAISVHQTRDFGVGVDAHKLGAELLAGTYVDHVRVGKELETPEGWLTTAVLGKSGSV